MKYGTICSKHDACKVAVGKIDVLIESVKDSLGNVDVTDPEDVSRFLASLATLEYNLSAVQDLTYEIDSTLDKCLYDGQQMEDGLVTKQKKINDLCDEVESLETSVEELQEELSDTKFSLSTFEAEHYNRQINGE